MGQKVNPIGLRLGITRTWNSIWFNKKNYSELMHEDERIRKFLRKELHHAGISGINIERAADQVRVNVRTARPGIIIGKRGQEVERVKQQVQELVKNKQVFINILEVKNPDVDAQLVAEGIALQLERRVSFRRAMKRALSNSERAGAKGIRILCAGRLGGAEMARMERYLRGRVPLHTLRADIDYGLAEARTTAGQIGVKVWVFRGETGPGLASGTPTDKSGTGHERGEAPKGADSGRRIRRRKT
ncbi:MAG TPA: 30S ribosomal protein S3, partial [Alphaproteobacteria bacterium]|nr:30S ribosomal protein S3 [Alphaproteobacteria bacterium]